jgi:hypothetical protein
LTIRYRSTKTKQAPLRLRIRDLAETRVGYGPSGDDPTAPVRFCGRYSSSSCRTGTQGI